MALNEISENYGVVVNFVVRGIEYLFNINN